MNKALRKELERYYLNDDYGSQPEMKEVKEARKAYYKSLEPLRQENERLYFDLDNQIGDSEIAYEKQGFLRGYEYCLTMLGLMKEDIENE